MTTGSDMCVYPATNACAPRCVLQFTVGTRIIIMRGKFAGHHGICSNYFGRWVVLLDRHEHLAVFLHQEDLFKVPQQFCREWDRIIVNDGVLRDERAMLHDDLTSRHGLIFVLDRDRLTMRSFPATHIKSMDHIRLEEQDTIENILQLEVAGVRVAHVTTSRHTCRSERMNVVIFWNIIMVRATESI